jgi:carbamoyltransferase
MNYVGISCGFHDAGLSVIDDSGNILFAGHSERYSMKKHDSKLCSGIIEDAKSHINDDFEVHYYERPSVKAVRQFFAKQKIGPLNPVTIIGNHNLYALRSMKHMQRGDVKTHNHHLCHASAGFQTSPYQDATVVVIDAIGELDTISIWDATYDKNGKAKYKKIWGRRYPDSIGLFYSAMTHRVGLRPLDEEYILMGMAAYGDPKYTHGMKRLFSDFDKIILADNLHIGVDEKFLQGADEMDIAASAQAVVEQLIETVMRKAKKLGKSDNLVYGGGVALNCLANRLIGQYYENIWIMPNPGDAGNSLGAAALGYGKKLNWTDAFLGFDIKGEYPVDNIIKELYTNKMVGVANGRAEFGPRALGNRSLLADPRGPEIKDKVNDIKRRQKFRPFAPIILEEHVAEYFDMPLNWSDSRYMQVIATCRLPDLFPAIVHHDGTSRVQTVPKDGSGIRKLLEQWYEETGCPMLLNTSLNIRGEPMVNDRSDADRFEKLYNVKVMT